MKKKFESNLRKDWAPDCVRSVGIQAQEGCRGGRGFPTSSSCGLGKMRWVDLAHHFMGNNSAALGFLSLNGLFSAPKYCPKGHLWVLFEPGVDARDQQPHFRCNVKVQKKPGCPKSRCGCSASWLQFSPFGTEDLPKILPWQTLGLLYCFVQMRGVSVAAFELSLSPSTCRTYYAFIRETLLTFMAEQDSSPIGGPQRPVCVDETHITTKKHTRSLKCKFSSPRVPSFL